MLMRTLTATTLLLLAPLALAADVLVLRDGRRVSGMLVEVRGERIDFESRDGRVRRYDRAEVRSILLDEDDEDRPGWGRGGGAERERTVSVDARSPWTDTGVTVRNGQDVTFTASGEVRWGPGRRDGAEGERNSPYNRARPMPDRNAAALIGRIGENGDPFFIGNTRGPLRLRGSGRLYLGINDDFLQDNSGALRVLISY
jgi:hypothetical protein